MKLFWLDKAANQWAFELSQLWNYVQYQSMWQYWMLHLKCSKEVKQIEHKRGKYMVLYFYLFFFSNFWTINYFLDHFDIFLRYIFEFFLIFVQKKWADMQNHPYNIFMFLFLTFFSKIVVFPMCTVCISPSYNS